MLLSIAGVAWAYLSALRAALLEASPSRLDEFVERQDARRDLRERLQREDELQATIAALRTAAAALTALSLHLLLGGISHPLTRVAAALASALAVLGLADAIAQGAGRARPEQMLLGHLGILCALEVLCRPIRLAAQGIGYLIIRLFGSTELPPEERLEEEIMEVVSEGEREGAIAPEHREMIESVIEFHDLDVGRMMTPRTEMIAIEDTSTISQARALIIEAAHSRIPVFHEDRDHIVGILHERDVLSCEDGAGEPPALAQVMREAHFVPENMRIRELLKQLKRRSVHMAIVLDEYGGTAGIITFTDLMEEIVGEVRDEHKHEAPAEIRITAPGCAEVLGTLRIDELNETMDLRLPEGGSFDTIGGLVESVAGRVPAHGEQIVFENVRLAVLDADERSVQRLRLEVLKPEDSD